MLLSIPFWYWVISRFRSLAPRVGRSSRCSTPVDVLASSIPWSCLMSRFVQRETPARTAIEAKRWPCQLLRAKLHYTDTGYGRAHNNSTTNLPHRNIPTSQHIKMLGCGKFLSVGGVRSRCPCSGVRLLAIIWGCCGQCLTGARSTAWRREVTERECIGNSPMTSSTERPAIARQTASVSTERVRCVVQYV